MSSSPLVIILSGPSGVGKGTLVKRLLQRHSMHFSVSATTRAMRPGEVDGVDYHFIPEEVFQSLLSADAFLEHAGVHGKRYGTLREEITGALTRGCDVLLDIDAQGALQVLAKLPDAVSVYVLPPSWEELERRLRARGTETEEAIVRRLQGGRNERQYIVHYEYTVINDDIDKAAHELDCILTAERLKTTRRCAN